MNDYRHSAEYKEIMADLLSAYSSATSHKSGSPSVIRFSMDALCELDELAHQLITRTYHPRPSIYFVVSNPVLREVIAADFRDRVVHHYVFDYISPMVERLLIHDCYSCRPGKGTSYGVRRLEHHIRSCSANYTVPAYCMMLDISGYFVSIRRALLHDQVMSLMDRIGSEYDERGGRKRDYPKHDLVKYLLEILIFHNPLEDAVFVGDRSLYQRIPKGKSLRHAEPGCGLPIGNLTSQLFSNIYLNGFDHYVKRELGVRHYGRYVDDFFLIDRSRDLLLSLLEPVREYLGTTYGLTIHPGKIRLMEVCRGVPYLGMYLKPHRRYVKSRSMRRLLHTFRASCSKTDPEDRGTVVSSINSCLGYLAYCRRVSFVPLRRPVEGADGSGIQ